MKKVKYKKNGGPLRVEVTCNTDHMGSHELKIRKSDFVTVVYHKPDEGEPRRDVTKLEERGYDLPGDPPEYDGKIIDVGATLKRSGVENYSVEARVFQRGVELTELGPYIDTGRITGPLTPAQIKIEMVEVQNGD